MEKLLLGDCLELMKGIESNSVDMILCDLPYGTTNCPWDTVIPFEPLWEQYKRIIKPKGAVVLFGSQPFTSALVMSNPKWFRHEWIWEKDRGANFLQGNIQPMKVHEIISVFGESSPNYYPIKITNPKKRSEHIPTKQKDMRKNAGLTIDESKPSEEYEISMLLPRTIQYFKRENGNQYVHPTQKPVHLCEYLIRTYTNEGETVLDNTMGSGTTGVACVHTKRNFIGIEKDETYFNIAKQRIEGAQLPLL